MRFSVTPSPRVRFSVECVFPHLGKRGATSRKSAFSNRRLTEKRSLHVGPHGKAHSVQTASRKSAFCADGLTEKRILCRRPHGKAHSARQQSPRVRLFVRVRPRVRFSVKCAFPHLRKRGGASRKSAFSNRRLTEKRSLQPAPHGKAQSARWASRKSAFCTPTVTQSASFRESPPQSALFRKVRLSSPAQTWRRLTEKRILQPAPHGKAHSATAPRPRPHGKAQSATAPRPQRDGKAQSAHDASRKAHSAIPRRAKLRLFVRQPSQSAPLTPRDTQCRRIRRGHLRSL